MAAPLREAVDLVMVQTHLGVADTTHPACAAAGVMMHHDAITHLDGGHLRPHLGHNAAWLMPADGQCGWVATLCPGRTVGPEVAAAEPGSLHRQHHFTGAWRWLGQLPYVDLPIPDEDHASHSCSLLLPQPCTRFSYP